jgi:hypothetical protein
MSPNAGRGEKESCGVSANEHSCTQEPIIKFLCTGAPLYAPYSLLLISNKFWMGGGWEGGESVGEKLGGRVGGGE